MEINPPHPFENFPQFFFISNDASPKLSSMQDETYPQTIQFSFRKKHIGKTSSPY